MLETHRRLLLDCFQAAFGPYALSYPSVAFDSAAGGSSESKQDDIGVSPLYALAKSESAEHKIRSAELTSEIGKDYRISDVVLMSRGGLFFEITLHQFIALACSQRNSR